MKASDFKEVEFLFKLMNNLSKALEYAEATIKDYESRTDSGGFENFNKGYACYVSRHSDRSGDVIDMSGCYVGLEVAEATEVILLSKREEVKARLYDLGVEMEA